MLGGIVNPTGVNHSSTPLSSLIPPVLSTNDQIILETLRGGTIFTPATDNDSLYRLIQDLPIGKNALHDIYLRFNVGGIWSFLSATGSFKINSFNEDISLPPWEIRGLSTNTTVHKSNTVSVVVGGSYRPIAVDFNGIIRL
jgi:hypothetical protein